MASLWHGTIGFDTRCRGIFLAFLRGTAKSNQNPANSVTEFIGLRSVSLPKWLQAKLFRL
jgi:hypothetical protein